VTWQQLVRLAWCELFGHAWMIVMPMGGRSHFECSRCGKRTDQVES